MNRSLKIKSLYMLALFLMVQPAVHCFSLEQLKTSLIQNFHHVKPYFTLDNVVKSAVLGTIVSVFGYMLYKAVKSPKANCDAVKGSQAVVEKPRPVISLEEHAAQLIEVITEIQRNVERKSNIDQRIEKDLARINSSIKSYNATSETETRMIRVGCECNHLFNAIKHYNKALHDLNEKEQESDQEQLRSNLEKAVLNVETTCENINSIMLDQ